MKIRAIGLGLMLAAALAGAQPAQQPFAVLLNNPEASAFHFVLDPPELAQIRSRLQRVRQRGLRLLSGVSPRRARPSSGRCRRGPPCG